MKRVFSVLLSLVLAFSLTIPALAAGEDLDPPLWQEYGFGSREECIEYFYGGDESAYEAEVEERLERQRWEASMADEIAAFDADAYWNSDECWYSAWYDSKEEFMEDWLLESEEQFRETMLEDWLDSQWQAYQQSTLVSRTLAELGGTPGQVGVMLDGQYIDFDGAVPEVINGVTMVPCQPVMEALCDTARREGGEMICTMSGTIFRLHSGSDIISVTTADGISHPEIQLGTACYEKNGVIYMALRPFAEALDCDVLWDSAFHTAVLLQRDVITAEVDQNFTILNGMLSALQLDPDQNYRTAIEMDAQLKMLDSINGDKNYDLDAEMEILQSGSVVNFTATMDLSALLELDAFSDAYGFYALEQAALRSALKNVKIELIYDGEEGMVYWKSPLLATLSQGAVSADSWIAMPGVPLETVRTQGPVTIGTLLYETLLTQAENFGGYYYYEGMLTPATFCRYITEGVEGLSSYIGDGCFQSSGGYQVLHYGEEEYNAALEAMYGEGSAEYMSDFDQLELELKVARSGNATFKVLVQNRDEGYYGSPVMLVDASGSLTPANVDMKLLLKVKNQLELNLQYTAVTAVTRETPRTQPPEGEPVVDPYEPDLTPETAA